MQHPSSETQVQLLWRRKYQSGLWRGYKYSFAPKATRKAYLGVAQRLYFGYWCKNAYEKEYGYTGFKNSFSKSLHSFLNWNDRYGHPSLTLPEGDYDGSVFYAGYICQRKGYLQVYLVSGRFERNDLNEEQTRILKPILLPSFRQYMVIKKLCSTTATQIFQVIMLHF